MDETPGFPDLLRLIDDRSAAFRAVVAAAPDLDARVPTCPEWTLLDLVHHLGEGRRSWAATIAAGPEAPGKVAVDAAVPAQRAELPTWLADSTRQLLDALAEAGADRGCWAWWDRSQSPKTCLAVARHQLQQVAVHTYDAQATVGDPLPLPTDIALDGVDEFLSTCCATTVPWPYEPAVVDYHADEGRSWRLHLSTDGIRVTRAPGDAGAADASATGSASDLVLLFYGRIPLDSLTVQGDRRAFDQLQEWEPE